MLKVVEQASDVPRGVEAPHVEPPESLTKALAWRTASEQLKHEAVAFACETVHEAFDAMKVLWKYLVISCLAWLIAQVHSFWQLQGLAGVAEWVFVGTEVLLVVVDAILLSGYVLSKAVVTLRKSFRR